MIFFKKLIAYVDSDAQLIFEFARLCAAADKIREKRVAKATVEHVFQVDKSSINRELKYRAHALRLLHQSPSFESRHLFRTYSQFAFFINEEKPAPLCMLCLRDTDKIAASHWISRNVYQSISDHWLQRGNDTPFSAAKLTLPLMCKEIAGNCENEHLSQLGESDFATKFLPLMIQVKAADPASEFDLNLDYGPWLFYFAASLVFRHLLVDLGNEPSWMTGLRELPGATESAFDMMLKTRQFLLRPTSPPEFHIRLLASREGFSSSYENEPPLVHKLDHYIDGPETVFKPIVLFGITGFYFLLSENREASDLVCSNPTDFYHHDINHVAGRLSITSADKLILPAQIKQLVTHFQQLEHSRIVCANPEIITQRILGKNASEGKGITPAWDTRQPEYIVQLPNGLDFKPGFLVIDEWEKGALNYDPQRYEMLSFLSDGKGSSAATWLMKHKHLGYHFVVIHGISETGVHMVAGYEFDRTKVFPEMAESDDMERFDFDIKTLRGSDHSLFKIPNEKEIVNTCVVFSVLMHGLR
jgi:hypothetical protein